jgi:hypothetical protein
MTSGGQKAWGPTSASIPLASAFIPLAIDVFVSVRTIKRHHHHHRRLARPSHLRLPPFSHIPSHLAPHPRPRCWHPGALAVFVPMMSCADDVTCSLPHVPMISCAASVCAHDVRQGVPGYFLEGLCYSQGREHVQQAGTERSPVCQCHLSFCA